MSLQNIQVEDNNLKLNSRKIEIILFGTKDKLQLVDIPPLSVSGTQVTASDNSRSNPGAIFHPSRSMTA